MQGGRGWRGEGDARDKSLLRPAATAQTGLLVPISSGTIVPTRSQKSVASATGGSAGGEKNRLGLSRQTSADKHAAKLPIGNQFVLRSVQTIFSHPCRAQAAQSFVMCVALFPPPPLPSPFHRIVVRQIVQIMLRH